jgi:hypothetical protein
MTKTRDLFIKLEKLEKESQNTNNLDQKTDLRIKENIQKITIENLKNAIIIIKYNANQRHSISYLYIYAKKVNPFRVFNTVQEYSFQTITQQEVNLRIQNNLEIGLNDIWNHVNRLTEYNEFTSRAAQLVDNLEAGKLEIEDNVTYGELLYEILGTEGQLLKALGIDPEKNLTHTILESKIQEQKRLHEYLSQ